jgi:hypothetical protein
MADYYTQAEKSNSNSGYNETVPNCSSNHLLNLAKVKPTKAVKLVRNK